MSYQNISLSYKNGVTLYGLLAIVEFSLRTDTQITFSLHFTPLGIRLSAFVAQLGAFLVLETIILGH